MKKKFAILAAMMISSGFTMGVGAADDMFTLDPVNVTAMRVEKANLETPADISVYQARDLVTTGEAHLAGALAYMPGITVSKMGPHDQSWITGNTDVILRGVTGGVLVLIDGVAVNFNGVSHLDAIPVTAVERVEVVKGAGAVLYGSGAYGGVINVITKKESKDVVLATAGTQGYSLGGSTQIDKLGVNVYTNHFNAVDKASSEAGTKTFKTVKEKYYFGFDNGQKDMIHLRYALSDNTDVTYLHTRKKHSISYHGVKADIGEIQHFDYNEQEKFLTVHHEDNGLQAKVYFQQRAIANPDYYTNHPEKLEWEKSNHRIYGIDVRQTWENDKNEFLVGAAVRHERYKNDNQKFAKFGDSESPLKDVAHFGTYTTTAKALYAQWEHQATDKLSTILSFRNEWVNADKQTISEFLPQAQLLYKVDEKSSLYANVGRSFRMPSFRNLFYSSGALAANPDLKPEYGMHYEIGYKSQGKMDSWQVAIFKLDLKDQLANRKTTDGRSQTYNAARYKNQGIDFSYERVLNDNLNIRFGAIFSNPKRQDNPTSSWKRPLGTYQLTNSLIYTEENYGASLNLSYFGNRIYPNGKDKAPLFTSNLTAWYKVDDSWKMDLMINNLFNRQDATNNGTDYDFYVPERSVALTISHFFN